MKEKTKFLICAAAMIFACTGLSAQNPNWTMPPNYFSIDGLDYDPLPTGDNTPNTFPYQGAPATNLHAGFSDNHGELMFFTVDEEVYDEKGYYVGTMEEYDAFSPLPKRGFNERLILPMGKSCSRFAILTIGSHDYVNGKESWSTAASVVRIEGNLIEEWYDVFYNPPHGVHYAATKERPDGVRRVFLSNNRDLYRLDLTCDGRPVQTGKLVKRP